MLKAGYLTVGIISAANIIASQKALNHPLPKPNNHVPPLYAQAFEQLEAFIVGRRSFLNLQDMSLFTDYCVAEGGITLARLLHTALLLSVNNDETIAPPGFYVPAGDDLPSILQNTTLARSPLFSTYEISGYYLTIDEAQKMPIGSCVVTRQTHREKPSSIPEALFFMPARHLSRLTLAKLTSTT